MLNPSRSPRPKLTWRIFSYACADIFGLTVLAISATWFIDYRPAVLATFPGNMAEAIVGSVAGFVVMFWGVAHVLRELAKQAPEMQKKYAAYAAERQGLPKNDK